MADAITYRVTPAPEPVEAEVQEGVGLDGQPLLDESSAEENEGQQEESSQQQDSADGQQEERPDWLPEKFKTVEDFLKSYKELEKGFTQERQQQSPSKKEGLPKIGGKEESQQESTEEAAKDAGVDLDALSAEYAKEGSLSDETYQDLQSKGYSRQFVDRYIAGQQAIAQQMTAQLTEAAGGDLEGVLGWARTNLSQGERDTFDSLIDSSNLEGALLAMRGIHARYVAANGKDPKLVDGESRPNSSSGVRPFASMDEASRALGDRRYERDPKFRREVDRRLAISDI